jgi:MoxR-like ATPase
MTDATAARFHQAMLDIYREALTIGYRPARLLQLINEHGGVATARLILSQSDPTEGFGTLWEKQRLDLAVEALVLKPEFTALFTEEERAKARARLADVNYRAPWDQGDSAPAAPSATPPDAPSLIERLSRAVSNTQGGDTMSGGTSPPPAQTGREQQSAPLYLPAALETLISRFRQRYASFADQTHRNQERFYKEHFAQRLRELLGRERLGTLIAQGAFEEAKALIKQAMSGAVVTPTDFRQQNNLLNQWDRRPVLDAPAEPLARRLNDLLYGEGPFDKRFDAWVELLSAAKPGVWPVATYFLMLHDPEQHIFVKPTVFQSALAALGVDHQWRTRPDAATYALFQQLAQQLRADLAPLAPADLIDVQSFLWSVSAEAERAWLFAANPDVYDLTGALDELDELRWRIPDFKDEIAPGQLAYLCVSGEQPALAAIARISVAPQLLENSEVDGRFHHGSPLDAYDTRAIVTVEQVFDPPLALVDALTEADLRGVLTLLQTHGSIHRLSGQEADVLAALVSAESDEDAVVEGDTQLAADFAEWRAGRSSQHPLVRRALDDYPAWLRQRFGTQLELRFYTRRPEIGVFIDGRWQHFVTFNAVKNGLYVLIDGLQTDELDELRSRLSRPTSLRQREYASKTGFRFFVDTEDDYALLKELVTRTVERVISRKEQPPPNPLDGPAFVVIHGENFGVQRLGSVYTFTRKAGGAPVQLLNAVRAWQAGGPPVYLIFYRPGPHYAFVGWARVSTARDEGYTGTDETLHILEYEWHPLPVPVNARELQHTVAWLGKGLRIAFQGKSIRPVSDDDVQAIVERAYPNEITPMTVANAAYLVLTRAGGGPMHLSDILAAIQQENLAELRGQTPQLSLASILLRDERFHNLGKNSWVLAAVEPTDDSDPDTEVEALPPEPQRRTPTIYAEDEAQFWRIHLPRELWERARRAGVIAIGWPADSQNQSVKRFRQIRVGDRIVAYVQGGTIGGIGAVVRAFDFDSPQLGFPLETIDPEFTLYIGVNWADAPTAPVELLDALRQPNYTTLYNRLKNAHTVIPLSRDDYIELLSLLQVDDVGEPRTASSLPNVWPQLAPYLTLARSLGTASFDGARLQEAARGIDPPPAEPLDANDLVAELMQLRLIEPTDADHYRLRPYVAGAERALLRLCVLGVLATVEGRVDEYTLPARSILPRLQAAETPLPAARFVPELAAADAITLAGWYAEAGLVAIEGDSWQPAADALEPLLGDDAATLASNQLLQTLLAESAGTLPTDLAMIELNAALPEVDDFEGRLRELGQELLFDSAVVRRIYRSLLAGRHVVLSGPPGTGKTELARRLPTLLWREAPVTFNRLTLTPAKPPVEQVTEQRDGYAPVVVTATEDWGVRDVVGGIGPRLDGQSGALSYTIDYGALTRVLLHHFEETADGRQLPPPSVGFARRDYRPVPRERYRGAWLVIDEFTRAPIDAAFGSLLTTLSGGRNATLAVPTRDAAPREVPLPRDFRVIGTLNSFDRHFLNQLSEAMKRRFDFIDVLPPAVAYAEFEQGIAVKEALRRMQADGFERIETTDGATFRWPGVVRVEPANDAEGLQRHRWVGEAPESEAALVSFWRLFSAVRVFRQLGTAQIIAVYLNLLTGVRVGMSWPEALDTALADGLADQLQVLSRDEQRTIEALIEHAGQAAAFATALNAILHELPLGRRSGYLYALRERDVALHQSSDIALGENAVLSEQQIGRVFAVETPLALPTTGVFRRRLRDLIGERGL